MISKYFMYKHVFQVGGYDGASRQCLCSVECYNPEMDAWTIVNDMNSRRSGAGMYSVPHAIRVQCIIIVT